MDHKFNVLLDGNRSSYPRELINPNINIISDIRTYNDSNREFSDTLVILESSLAIPGFTLSLELVQNLYGFKVMYISKRSELRRVMEKYGDVFNLDPSVVNYDLLSSYKNKDFNSVETILSDIRFDHKDIKLDPQLELAYLRNIVDVQSKELQLSEERANSLLERLTLEREEAFVVKDKFMDLMNSVVKTDITLTQLEAFLSKSIYEQVDIGKYERPPRILYVKEYQDLPYKFSLIRILYDSIKLILRKPVKVLAIADSTSSRKLHYVPNYYNKVFNSFTKSDILSKEYVMKVGDYREVLDLLLTNTMSLDTLIIFDLNDHTGSVVNKSNLNFALARDFDKTEELGVSPHIIVTDKSKDPLAWEHYPEVEELSEEDKFIFLSSRPLIQRIIHQWGGS